MSKGYVILLTGVSGSGKTTLGSALKKYLARYGKRPVEFIDGDMARKFLEIESGYSLQERFMVTKQIAYAAQLLAENGIDVIVANIAGSYSTRDYLRRKWKRYIQIFLDADVGDCIKHDIKGIYKKALRGSSPFVYGIDIPYQKPRKPHVTVFPYKETKEESLKKIKDYFKKRRFFK